MLQYPALLAQLVEQVTLNHRVGGSSPSQRTNENAGQSAFLELSIIKFLNRATCVPQRTKKRSKSFLVLRETLRPNS